MMRKWLMAVTAAMSIGMGGVQAFAEVGADALVLKVSNDVLSEVRTGRSTYADDPDTLEKTVEALLDPVIDFDAFAKGVMGRHYDKATGEQRARFKAAFKATLAELYTANLVRVEIVDIAIDEVLARGDDRATVRTKVTTKGEGTFTVQYSMRRDDKGAWKARNLIIDGVNVGLTYRSQFDGAVASADGNLESVVAQWPELID